MSNLIRSCVHGVVVLLFVSALAAQPDGVTVPMRDVGGRPVIDVAINGAAAVPMLLDTGASRTVVFPAWVGGVEGPVTLNDLTIGGYSIAGMPAQSQVLFGGQAPPEFPKGVLSALAFAGHVITIDYINRTVYLRKGALPAADGKRVFAYPATDVLPVVPVTVGGKVFNIHLDSGSPGGVTLPVKASEQVELAEPLARAGRARTNTGEFDVFAAAVKGTITVGEFALDHAKVRFSDVSPGPRPGPGNLGYEVLRTFKVSVDSTNRRVMLDR